MEKKDHTIDDPLNNVKDDESENEEPLFKDDDDDDDSVVSKKNNATEIFDDDLLITVSDPAKEVLMMETYISYKVTTNTTRPSFDSSQFVVKRRYQDFVWLREKLEEEYPTYILPPLPSKFVVKGVFDRFSNEFIEIRCKALNKFLQRLAKHSVVSFNDHLKSFLSSDNFSATGKQGLLSRVSGSIKWSSVSVNNSEFQPISDSVTLYGEQMGAIDRINERLIVEKKELHNEIKELAPTFNEWGKCENTSIESIMASINDCLELCADEAESNLLVDEQDIGPALKEYGLFSENIKQVLKRRDNFQYNFEKVNAELKAKKEERENLGTPAQSYSIGSLMGKTSEQKEEKLVQQIKELALQREKLSDDLAKANANFQVDFERWKSQKLKDNVEMLVKMASSQVSYHDNCVSAWEQILPSLKKSLKA